MRSLALLLLCIPSLLVSCNGNDAQHLLGKDAEVCIGDTVKELGANIMVIHHDTNGNHWFGSHETGLYRYDGTTNIHYALSDAPGGTRIDEITEDKLGNVYVNTRGTILRFNGERFDTIPVDHDSESAWALSPDDLWFRGFQDSACVYRYDGAQLHRLRFPRTAAGDAHRARFPSVGYSPYDVYCTYRDSHGNVWFGTSSLGVCRYNGSGFTWFSKDDLRCDVETSFGIRSILEDIDGRFLFSNTLHRYRVVGPGVSVRIAREPGIGSLDGRADGDLVAVMSMARVGNHLWMATYRHGVYRYDGERITHYPVQHNGNDITVFSIYKDNQDTLWLGTHDHGAYRFTGEFFEQFKP